MSTRRSGLDGLTAEQRRRVEESLEEAYALAYKMAWRYRSSTREELRALAENALIRAVPQYDPSRGPSLAQFARKAIAGEILDARQQASDALRAAWKAGDVHDEASKRADLETEMTETDDQKRARAMALGRDRVTVMLWAYEGKRTAPSVEDEYESREEQARLQRAVSKIGEEPARLLTLLYWQDATWDEAAAALGISVSTAKRIERETLPRLRAILSSQIGR